MIPRILLAGKNGQVGMELATLLPGIGEVVAVDRQRFDLTSPANMREVIRDVHPQLIVNAAAYTAVDLAEKEESLARSINADAPRVIAEEAKKIGAALVHYSTDYVFDGSKNAPYDESDRVNPINVYGRTKFEGEEAIRKTGVPHLIFRSQWVYGTRGRNFLLTVLRLAIGKEELRIVSDQFGAPTSSQAIAHATTDILRSLFQPEDYAWSFGRASGTYHMTAAGQATWHEFASAIIDDVSRVPPTGSWFSDATSAKPLLTRRVIPIATWDYPTPARRPAYSVLSNHRLSQTFAVQLPDWHAQLRVVLTSD
jgi:dTDP-4-dehydrorhamnose reductase